MLDRVAEALAAEIAAIGRRFYARGWALGTSGNFSAVVSREPFRLAVTASGVSKREMTEDDILICNDRGELLVEGSARPSAETLLHVELAARRGVEAVLHTHSVWSTILSARHAGDGGVALQGFEMLKGLSGVGSHEHREWIPVLGNDQDMTRLARVAAATLDEHPVAHAFLLDRHGLYTWGASLAEAERHVEILEFLIETSCRMADLRTNIL